MRRSHSILIALLVLPLVARADVGPPMQIEVVYDDTAPPVDGAPYSGAFRLTVAEPVALGTVEVFSERDPITQQRGWEALQLDLIEPDVDVDPESPVTLGFDAECNDATQPIEFSYVYGGKRFTHTLSMLPPRVRPLDSIPDDVFVPMPTNMRTPTIIEPTTEAREEARVARERLEHESESLDRRATYTVTGRFIYHRQDDDWSGVEGATVRLYDQDDAFDDLLGVTTTNAAGVFDFTVPVGLGELFPDLYVQFEMANNKVEIEIPGWQNTNYRFYGVMYPDFFGPELDMGNMGFYEGDSKRPLAHLLHWYTRAAQWMADRGFGNINKVGVWFPDGDNAFYSPTYDNIHVSWARRWDGGTQMHEYGHHWLSQFADYGGTNYCNAGGYCDDPGDCGHCDWCPETSADAWREGFPDWLTDAIGRTFEDEYGNALISPDYYETISKCTDGGADFYGSAYTTEGAIAGLLRDIDDAVDPSDSQAFSPAWGDAMDRNTKTILDFVDVYKPTTPSTFVSLFLAAHLNEPWFDPAAYWETCANNGYELVDDTAPGAPTGLTSTSHDVGIPNSAAKLRLEWNQAPDGFSGVDAYAVSITSSPALPGASVSTQSTKFVTGNLEPGTYYANVRARDRAGNWGSGYDTYGPVIVDEPTPPDLGLENVPRGWAMNLIPRSDLTATSGSVPIDDILANQSQGNTYFNLAISNNGMQAAFTNWTTRVRLDGEEIASWTTSLGETIAGLSQKKLINWAGHPVLGGRHHLSAITDPFEFFAEENEDDNYVGRQWVFNPELLAQEGVGYFRDAPPDPLGGREEGSSVPLFYPVNCDGLRFAGNGPRYSTLTIRPVDSTDDYDARLHPPSTNSQSGFDVFGVVTTGGWSSRGPGETDIVLVQNTSGVQLWDVGVINQNDGTGAYVASRRYGTEIVFGSDVQVDLGTNQYSEILEFEPPSGGDGAVQIVVQLPPGAGRTYAALYPPEFTTGDLLDSVDSGDATSFGEIVLTGSSSASNGKWGVAVWRDPKDQPILRAQSGDAPAVSLTVTASMIPANMTATVPAGWAAPIVPRSTGDATPTSVTLPDSLIGEVASTYVSFAWENAGSETIPLALVDVELDGVSQTQYGYGPVEGGGVRSFNAGSPLTVRGGRHTIGMRLDGVDLVAETDETDNASARQWVWRPATLVPGAFAVAPTPPPAAAGADDVIASGNVVSATNADGHRTPMPTPSGGDAWWQVVAVLPDADADVDLTLYERSTSALTGFDEDRARSARGPGVLDYVAVSHRATAPRPFDVGVTNLGTAPGGYAVETVRSTGLVGSGPFAARTLGPDRIVDVVELELQAGTTLLRVHDVGAEPVDWGVAVHRSDFAYHDPLTEVAEAADWIAPAGEAEIITFDVPVDGRYAVIVYKATAASRGADGAYELSLATGFTGVETTPVDGRARRIASIRPNPFNPRTEIHFALDRRERVRLEIYNVRGDRVRGLVDATFDAGGHRVVWDGLDDGGRRAASGVYLVRLHGDDFADQRKVTLLK